MAKGSHTKTHVFTDAYTAHSDAIFRYCLFRVSDRERALDMMQETFTKTWDYMRKNNEVSNIKAFLYKTASNLVIDEYRRRKPVSSLEEMNDETGFEPLAQDSNLFDKIDGQKALKLIDELPEPYGNVVFLRFVEELSLVEISEITGDTSNAIAVQIHRGIERLRKIWNHDKQ
jgi:RNA polymerase sigma-70 factor (ECF subfamily)